MIRSILVSVLSACLVIPAALAQPLETFGTVDLGRYAGKWYEIASYPQKFEEGCHCTTATYTLTEKNYVIVENRCMLDSINGKLTGIRGKAFVEKNSGNAKLKVQFFWPFRGKYWIIDLAPDYRYAVVSHPGRQYLWILSRTPQIIESDYQGILSRLREKGFDTGRLRMTLQ